MRARLLPLATLDEEDRWSGWRPFGHLGAVVMLVIPIFARGAKAVLVQSLLDYVMDKENDGYRQVLNHYTKKRIDDFLIHGGATKAHSIQRFIDRDLPMPTVEGQTMPTVEGQTLVPFQPKSGKRLIRFWKGLGKRAALSNALVTHLKMICAQDGAAHWSVQQVHDELQRRLGVDFNEIQKRNMHLFFHKKLRRIARSKHLRSKNTVAQKKLKPLPPLQFTSSTDAASEKRERSAMWDEDKWMFKYSLISLSDRC